MYHILVVKDVLRLLGSDPSRKGSDSLVVVSYHGIQTSERFFKGRSHKVANMKIVYSSTDAPRINTATNASDCKSRLLEHSTGLATLAETAHKWTPRTRVVHLYATEATKVAFTS